MSDINLQSQIIKYTLNVNNLFQNQRKTVRGTQSKFMANY